MNDTTKNEIFKLYYKDNLSIRDLEKRLSTPKSTIFRVLKASSEEVSVPQKPCRGTIAPPVGQYIKKRDVSSTIFCSNCWLKRDCDKELNINKHTCNYFIIKPLPKRTISVKDIKLHYMVQSNWEKNSSEFERLERCLWYNGLSWKDWYNYYKEEKWAG